MIVDIALIKGIKQNLELSGSFSFFIVGLLMLVAQFMFWENQLNQMLLR